MEKVSVLMCAYKEPIEWFNQAVQSVLRQTYENLELIVVVDNPENGEVLELLSEYQNEDSRIKVVLNDKNMGLVKSLNKGINYCTGDFIARMDADDISDSNRISCQLNYIKKTGYDLVGSEYDLFFEDRIIRTVRGAYTYDECKEILKYMSCVAHPAWFGKPEMFRQLGYRDIDACEDLDFLQRAIVDGFKVGNCPKTLLRYRDNPNSISHEKGAKQIVITQYISKQFRKGRIASIEEYNEFCKSKRFNMAVKAERKALGKEKTFTDNSVNYGLRVIAFFQLLLNPRYLYRKIILYKVRRIKRAK